MSVSCRIFSGLTIEIARDLTHADFKKYHEFIEKHPELDEYTYDHDDREGKILLIVDGMNGEFLRLVHAEIIQDNASLGPTNEFIERDGTFWPPILNKMLDYYEEYTGTKVNEHHDPEVKDALWSQWY